MTDPTLSCPVCFEAYSPTEGSAFALHVSSCSHSNLSPLGSPSSSTAHCPLCLHVYTAGTPAHEISFHEHECARVNELPDEKSDDESLSTPANRNNKRPRNDAVTRATPSVTLFPSTCFLCGNSGRGLLHCGGRCARSAHKNCVDQLQAPSVGEPLSVSERRQAADSWKCAQCVRSVHRCQHCGFLGHEVNGMRKCTVVDCGYYFHAHCLPEATTVDFVCSRHTCATCGTQETDMKRCKSCLSCNHMTHLRCPKGSGAPATGLAGLDPLHLFKCPRHDTETRKTLISSPDASNSLRLRLAAGDVVLVLEFNNALLPSSAKKVAPDVANHWGVVVSVEETEPHRLGNQLLSVRMFADDNVLDVPNQYALRVTTALDFSRPVDLICHCLQRHVMVELQLRQMEGNVDRAEEKRILSVSRAAFAARLKALGVTAAQATRDTEQGLACWRRFQELPQPRQYDGLGDSAPSFLYIDTRGRRYGQQTAASGQSFEVVTVGADEDMSMADSGKGGGATNGGACTFSRVIDSIRPTDAGESSHDNEADKSVEKSGIFVDETDVPQQTNTQMTDLEYTKDLKLDGDDRSQFTSTSIAVSRISRGNSAHISSTCYQGNSGGNMNKRTADCIGNADVKCQKISSKHSAGMKAHIFTPTDYRGLQPGATLRTKSAPATLHMAPTASHAIFPQKRIQMTRKQKVLANMPPLLLKELKREACRFLENADGSRLKSTRLPADADAFPWAARSVSLRPAFYRPTVILGHSGLRRPGVDAVSRLLVCQDKRTIKCFVQTTAENARMTWCSHATRVESPSASPGFVLLDLMSLHNFRDLELVVRTRLVEALGTHSRYTRKYFGMDVLQAQRWLERQRRRNVSEQPPMSLFYCALDGMRYQLELKQSSLKPSFKDKQAWVCFCANACHLSVAITAPVTSTAASMPITSVAHRCLSTTK